MIKNTNTSNNIHRSEFTYKVGIIVSELAPPLGYFNDVVIFAASAITKNAI